MEGGTSKLVNVSFAPPKGLRVSCSSNLLEISQLKSVPTVIEDNTKVYYI